MSLSEDEQRKLIEAQILIAKSMDGISLTLSKINDQNILHASVTSAEHKTILDTMKEWSTKYWWIIVITILALIFLAGAEKVLKFWPI